MLTVPVAESTPSTNKRVVAPLRVTATCLKTDVEAAPAALSTNVPCAWYTNDPVLSTSNCQPTPDDMFLVLIIARVIPIADGFTHISIV